MENTTLTAIPGILAGHATDAENRTGCTAVLCAEGFTPGVHVPGFAPGCRETELMRPEATVDAVHGILLSGGSAFGLAAADGVVRFLRENGHGIVMPHGTIPLVPGAVIYDLDMNGRPGFLPDADMGYAAAASASNAPLAQGSVGAGTGARCGRMFAGAGGQTAKSGLGSALETFRDIRVASLVVVNALGNVHDPETGAFLAGGRDGSGRPLTGEAVTAALAGGSPPESNTVLAVVAANVPLDKMRTNRLARMASSGIARAVVPAHLTYDGDIVFALAPRPGSAPPSAIWTENLLGVLASNAVTRAAANAVRFAGQEKYAPTV